MNQSIKMAKVARIMRRIAQARLPGGVKYFVGETQITGPGTGSEQAAKEARLKELEAKTKLTPTETEELKRLREELNGTGVTQTQTIHVDKLARPRIFAGFFPVTAGQRAMQLRLRALMSKMNRK
jgi:hypothetical protein